MGRREWQGNGNWTWGGGLVPERRPKGNGRATTVEGCWRGYSGRNTPQITIAPVAKRATSAGNGSPSDVGFRHAAATMEPPEGKTTSAGQ
jgi:hypothetical protein